MCGKVADTFLFAFDSVAEWYKTQEMSNKVVSENSIMLKNCVVDVRPNMCDKAVDAFLPVLKLIPDWFVTKEMTKK